MECQNNPHHWRSYKVGAWNFVFKFNVSQLLINSHTLKHEVSRNTSLTLCTFDEFSTTQWICFSTLIKKMWFHWHFWKMWKIICANVRQIKTFVGALAYPAAQFYKRISVNFLNLFYGFCNWCIWVVTRIVISSVSLAWSYDVIWAFQRCSRDLNSATWSKLGDQDSRLENLWMMPIVFL